MYPSHINVTMPKDGEAIARMFYTSQLGLRELQRPECVDVRDGVRLDAGGLVLHLSVDQPRMGADSCVRFGP